MTTPIKLGGFALAVALVFGGAYGLFLDFQHQGAVRTAAFTATAGSVPNERPHGDHDHEEG